MKISEVINVYGVLAELAQVKMPAQTGYKIAKNLQKFESEFKFFENKRKKLVETYFVGTEIIPGKQNEVDKEYTELVNVEVELEPVKLNLSELESINLTPLQMIQIDCLLNQ